MITYRFEMLTVTRNVDEGYMYIYTRVGTKPRALGLQEEERSVC